MLVFRPVSEDELRGLAQGRVLTGPAWAATPSFRDAFGLDPGDDEDAERTALYIAALAGLIQHGRRLVVVAETPASDSGTDFGAVGVDRLAFEHVTALFADDPSAQPLAEATRSAIAQLGVEDAWGHPAHGALLAEADLLWYGPEEWAVLAAC